MCILLQFFKKATNSRAQIQKHLYLVQSKHPYPNLPLVSSHYPQAVFPFYQRSVSQSGPALSII